MLFVIPRASLVRSVTSPPTVPRWKRWRSRRRPSGARSQDCLEATKTSAQAGHAEGLVISQTPPAMGGV